ncbi:MAG: lysostaphin resistance A-like protein [Ilumatobacteraceae bacterium]
MPDHVPRTAVRTGRGRIDVRIAVAVWGVTWVAGQVLYQVVASTSGDTADDATLPISTLAIAVVATWCAYLAGLWWASDRAGSRDFVADYGLRFEVIDLVGVPVGLLTQLVLVPLVYVPLRGLWPDTFSDDRLEETARDLVDRADGASVVVLALVVVVGAPIVEELVYRGLLQGSFAARISELPALLAGASWFAIIHFRPVEYPGLFVAGLVFGVCALTTGRLGMSIVTHAAFNATGLLTVAAAG